MAVGFRFKPTEEELIEFYLKPKIAMRQESTQIPSYVHLAVKEKEIYSASPWKLFDEDEWQRSKVFDDGKTKKSFYVFTELQKKSDGGMEQFDRSAGCGTWDLQARPKKIKNGNGGTIGRKKMLVFEVRGSEEDVNMNMGHWVMHEYSVFGVDSGYVLCEVIHDSSNISKKKYGVISADCGGDGENYYKLGRENLSYMNADHHELNLPLGYRFSPTDEELMTLYLGPKNLGHQPVCNIVEEKQLYSDSPWKVFDDEKDGWQVTQVFADGEIKKRSIYVFTKLKKKPDGKKRLIRSAGCGIWDCQTRPKKIKNIKGDIVGIKKMLAFQIRDPTGLEDVNVNMGHWIMHEYSSCGVGNSDYVLCEIICKNSKTSKKKPDDPK